MLFYLPVFREHWLEYHLNILYDRLFLHVVREQTNLCFSNVCCSFYLSLWKVLVGVRPGVQGLPVLPDLQYPPVSLHHGGRGLRPLLLHLPPLPPRHDREAGQDLPRLSHAARVGPRSHHGSQLRSLLHRHGGGDRQQLRLKHRCVLRGGGWGNDGDDGSRNSRREREPSGVGLRRSQRDVELPACVRGGGVRVLHALRKPTHC